MSLTIDLDPKTEAALRAEAERTGVRPEALAAQLIRERVAPSGEAKRLSREEWLRRADAWAESHRDWPVLPAEAYERESFYQDRA